MHGLVHVVLALLEGGEEFGWIAELRFPFAGDMVIIVGVVDVVDDAWVLWEPVVFAATVC